MASRQGAPGRVMVSAHRCNSVAAVRSAIGLGVDLVEFDVICSPSGPRIAHAESDPEPAAAEAVDPDDTVSVVLGLIAASTAVAHLDLKSGSARGAEAHVAVVRQALDVLGPRRLLVTSRHDEVVRAVADAVCSQTSAPTPLVALSLGGSTEGAPPLASARRRVSEVLPRRRLERSGADAVAAHWSLAGLGARHTGRPVLVWTVDADPLLRYWLTPGRAWAVTTNRPERALALRHEIESGLRG